MSAKEKIVQGRGLSNLNLGIFVCSFDVRRASKPFPSINYESTKQQNTTTTTVKNPNRPEANQLAICKCRWEVEPGTTRNKFNEWSERVLNPESPDLKASALTTGSHCLIYYFDFKIDCEYFVLNIRIELEIDKAIVIPS